MAAIYVDPTYRVSLTESQQNKAKATLFNVGLATRMTGLDKEIKIEQEDEDTASPASKIVTQSSGSSEYKYENILDEKERARKRQQFEGEKAEIFHVKLADSDMLFTLH